MLPNLESKVAHGIARLTKHNIAIVAAAVSLSKERQADALLILLDGSADWKRIIEITDDLEKPVIVAVDDADDLEGAAEVGLKPIALNKEKSPLLERLQHALLESAADELIRTNGGGRCVQRFSARASGYHQLSAAR